MIIVAKLVTIARAAFFWQRAKRRRLAGAQIAGVCALRFIVATTNGARCADAATSQSLLPSLKDVFIDE